ncbi:MAG TPA: sigma-70 family RNA polymerase sigma factor [Planctomycetota bacterium]|nr:sigma-70 family RNA polymerase sigma factor [Planctomycetota bacterium]
MDTTTDQLLRHADFVRRLCRGILSDADAADDVAQDTLAAALGRPGIRAPRAWLAAVARRLAARHVRGEARRARREAAAARGDATPSTHEIAAQADLQRRLAEEVRALDEPYRTVVILRYFHDLTPKEIARKLGAPYETVHARLRRAHALLRARLDATHDRHAWTLALAALAWPRRTAPALAGVAVAALAALCVTLLALGATDRRGRATDAASSQPAVETEAHGATADPAVGTDPVVPDQPARVRATGHVTTFWGRPLPGARVVVMPTVYRGNYWERYPLPPAPLAETTAAGDGSFAIDAPPGSEWVLLAHAPGHAWKGIRLLLDVRRDFLEVRLQRGGGPLAGVVVDEAGAPVALARVRAVADGAEVPGAFARTGTDGRFGFDDAFNDLSWVHVDHDALAVMEGGTSCPLDRMRLVLGRGETVSGEVLAADGSAVAGARIWLSGWPPSWKRMGTSDAGGRFVLDRLPLGEGERFAVGVDGGARGNIEMKAIPFAPGMQVPVRLPAAIAVRGRVVEFRGAGVVGPVAGMRIEGMRPGGMLIEGWTSGVMTDEEGRFELHGVVEGRADQLEIMDPRFVQDWRAKVPDLAPDEVGIAVRRVGSVSGSIVDEEGRPVAGAVVRVVSAQEQRWFGMDAEAPDRPASDEHGVFRIAAGPASDVCVRALKPGFLPGRTESFAIADAQELTGLVIRLERGAVLRGRVSDPAGRPVAGASIGALGQDAFTDEEGSFALGGLKEGPTSVYVSCFGYQTRIVQAAVGEDSLSVVLEPSLTFRGRLRTADGGPLPFAHLGRGFPAATRQSPTARQGDGWTRSLEDGSFAFRDVAAGKFSLGLRERGWELVEPEKLYDSTAGGVVDVLVRRKSGKRISGFVLDADGQPFPFGEAPAVTAMPEGTDDPARWRQSECRQDGRFAIENLEDVEHVLVVRSARAVFEERRVKAGASDLRILPSRPRTLAGRVLDADGNPVGGCEVRALPPGKKPLAVHRRGSRREVQWPQYADVSWAGADGCFRFDRLPAERVAVWAFHEDHGLLVETVETDREDLELRLPRGLALAGVLLDAERRPLADHQVIVAGADRMVRQAKTDANGAFELRGLPEGACEVSVTDRNGQVVLETTLVAGTGGAELRLPAR